MTVKAVDIEATLAGLEPLRGRGPATSDGDAAAAFAELARFRDGGLFVGSFEGDSGWERHTGGDEIVHVLKGATTLTILTEDGPTILHMSAGTITVVPRGCWHRFRSEGEVTVLTATPQPTEHSFADDPTGA